MERRTRTGLFYVVITLFWMSMYSYMPILSTHSKAMGALPTMIGSIASAYGLTQMCLRIPLGILSDKLKMRKIFVIIGCATSAASALGLMFSTTPVMLMIFRGLAGVAASSWVTFTVLFSSYFDPATAPQAMARVNIYNNLGQMTALFLGGQVAQHFGSRFSFLLSLVFAGCAFALSFFITEKRPESVTPITGKAIVEVVTDKLLLSVSCLAIVYQVIQQGTVMGFTPMYVQELGGTSAQQGYITSISLAGSMIAAIISSRFLLKKLGARRCILIGQLITATFTVLIALAARSVWQVFVFQFVAGLGNGITYPLLMGLAIKNIRPERRSIAMGSFQSIYALGMFIGPLLTGVLNTGLTLSTSLCIVACLGYVAFAAGLFVLPKDKQGAR